LRYFVTGCAGFIGSHLTERLLSAGHAVVGYDNFATGQECFLEAATRSNNFRLVRGDVLDPASLRSGMQGSEFVIHLAANADVRFGTEHPRRDLEQNTLATHAVLEAMRENQIRKIAFASSGSVYGDPAVFPTPEEAPFPVQTSLYGASKAAGEGLIGAYCAGFGFQAHIFRFVSILGERYTHGHIFDFYKQLTRDPRRLRVQGDGRQRKSYLYVHDCIEAMMTALEKAQQAVNIFNLGGQDYCEVRQSIGWICENLRVTPAIEYGTGDRGWAGDSPFVLLDTAKIRATGWSPRVAIRDGVLKTLEYLKANQHLLESRR
jgi:UDP-glucose 4-epimerase